ncbi:MAG: glutamyl-tRNA reductase [Brachybacterium sp.]|nr:glutamyl-tRNA reductase [Brachybacterium sp.]
MLVAVRATHEHLDLGVLEALTRGSEDLPGVIGELHDQHTAERRAGGIEDDGPLLDGWVVVATCNRLEVYLDTRRFHDGVDLAVRAVARTSGLSPEHIAICLETAMDAPVAEHLFAVTAGLRSIVMGEAEIAGQVRAAFESSLRGGTSSPVLNDLFQTGFRYAKKVSTRTPVGAAGRSGVAIALDRAEDLLGDLRDRSVLVIGTGAYARLGVAELTRRGVRGVRVHSGSGRAVAFAERHGVASIPAEDLPEHLRAADLVLACSGRGTSLFPDLFLAAEDLLVLDLALHSDLHPLVRHLHRVRVLDLTDLAIEVDEETSPALREAKGIIADGVDHFRSRQQARKVDPAMVALRRTVGEAADDELARVRRDMPADVADDVERSVRRILAKVMHSPTTRVRELASKGNADEVVEAFHTIFGIDISGAEPVLTGEQQRPTGWMRLDQTVPPRLDVEQGGPAAPLPGVGDGEER